MTNPRRLALETLLKMKLQAGDGPADGYSNILVDSAIKAAGKDLSDADRGLYTKLVAGCVERRITLDYIISKLSSRPIAKLDSDVLNIIRLGIWQLRYADRIPEHAAVNETVNLCKKYTKSFVNAMLRSYLRQKDEIALADGNGAYALSVKYSVSKEICKLFLDRFGEEKTLKILESTFETPGITLRTNTLKKSRDELRNLLSEEGFDTSDTPCAPFGLKLTGGSGMPKALLDGLCFVQDEASQICASVLDAHPGDMVLDVCACPGSKSFGASMSMNNEGEIVSCDLHASKLPLVEKGAKRLGIKIIKTLENDSSEKKPEFEGRFDRIICDVPCSGFGVIAKKPEIRYKDLRESLELPDLQLKILEASATALKSGGTLVYSTCTILPSENEENVNKFLSAHPEFEAVSFECGTHRAHNGMLTLWPYEETDGFFMAKLTKTK